MNPTRYLRKTFVFTLVILLVNTFSFHAIAKERTYRKALVTNMGYSEEYIGNTSMSIGGFFENLDMIQTTNRRIKQKHYYISLETAQREYLLHYTVKPIFGKYPNWAIGDNAEVEFNEVKSLAYLKLLGSEKHIKMRILKRVKRGFVPRGDLSF